MAKIYKLTCEDPELIYYGSTIQQLYSRLSHHKCCFQSGNSVSSKRLFEKGNVEIHLIEECSIEDRLKRERYYIENFPCVNIRVEGRTKREYHYDNQETILERGRKWRKENELRSKAQQKEYYLKNIEKIKEKREKTILCDCGKTITICKLKRHKLSKQHQNYINNVTKLTLLEKKEKLKEKISCVCGSIVRKADISKHKKTKKHQDYINNL